MIFLQLLSAVLALGVDQMFTSRYGALGMVCLFLLGAGIRTRDTACVYTGAVLFLLLMVQA